MFASLSSVSGFPNTYFKEHLSMFASKYSICNMENKTYGFTLCSMFKHSPNGKSMVYGPNGKGIMALIEYTLIIYGPSGKSMVLWNIIFPSGMIKDKKWCTMKDTMSIKISFTHYRNYIAWTTVKLPVVFEEFDMFFFWLLDSFHYYCQLLIGQL